MFIRKASSTGLKVSLLSFIAGAALLAMQAPVIGSASADRPGTEAALDAERHGAPGHYRNGLEPPSPRSHIG